MEGKKSNFIFCLRYSHKSGTISETETGTEKWVSFCSSTILSHNSYFKNRKKKTEKWFGICLQHSHNADNRCYHTFKETSYDISDNHDFCQFWRKKSESCRPEHMPLWWFRSGDNVTGKLYKAWEFMRLLQSQFMPPLTETDATPALEIAVIWPKCCHFTKVTPFDQSDVIWLERCHLTKVLLFDQSDVIWSKRCHLTKVLSFYQSSVIWPKRC